MSHSPVSWEYQDEIVSSKLAQMVENHELHDHRADGTQGADLVGTWTASGATIAAGWSLSTNRYRLLLGGILVAYDFVVTRTGADLVAAGDGTVQPGNLTDNLILSGIPAAARVSAPQNLAGDALGPVMFTVESDGSISLISATTSGVISTGRNLRIRGVLWR
jgi:hypothetical protein